MRQGAAARAQGERLFTDLLDEHRTRLKEERERAAYAYDARYQAIGRIGLPRCGNIDASGLNKNTRRAWPRWTMRERACLI